MNTLPFLSPHCLFIEIGQSTFKVLDAGRGQEWPLERAGTGRLTSACRGRLVAGLQKFLGRQTWRWRPRALCAISARGVSLRRLSVPASSREEFENLLRLQIESEFPLPPEQLAWGYRALDGSTGPIAGVGASRDFVVAALKRETIQEYAGILRECGLSPSFTLAAWARGFVCPRSAGACAFLDIGAVQSELTSYDRGVPVALRVISWGVEDVIGCLANAMQISREKAQQLETDLEQKGGTGGPLPPQIFQGLKTALGSAAELIDPAWLGSKLYLTGGLARLRELAPALAEALGGTVACEPINLPAEPACSAATLGLRRLWEQNGSDPGFLLELPETEFGESQARAAQWKWTALAAGLLVVLFSLRYADAVLFKPGLTRRLSEVKVHRDKLPEIDRELTFLQHLQQSQPPFLDAMFVIANAAPRGTRLESLSLNRRGDISMRGTMQDPQHPVEFRSKLIDSGFFSAVVLDEQTPSPDRRKVTFRLTAQWKPAAERPPLPEAPPSHPVKATRPGSPTQPPPPRRP